MMDGVAGAVWGSTTAAAPTTSDEVAAETGATSNAPPQPKSADAAPLTPAGPATNQAPASRGGMGGPLNSSSQSSGDQSIGARILGSFADFLFGPMAYADTRTTIGGASPATRTSSTTGGVGYLGGGVVPFDGFTPFNADMGGPADGQVSTENDATVKKPSASYDRAKAADALYRITPSVFDDQGINRSYEYGVGLCATYVNKAMREGGINLFDYANGRSLLYAKDYGPVLQDAGFGLVADKSTVKDYAPQIGDIMVVQPWDIKNNPAGHIQMYLGVDSYGNQIWAGDFQYKFYPNLAVQKQGTPYAIYRFNK
jgi:hypothetical protein